MNINNTHNNIDHIINNIIIQNNNNHNIHNMTIINGFYLNILITYYK